MSSAPGTEERKKMWICKGFQKPGLEEERAVHSPLARRRLDDQAAFESLRMEWYTWTGEDWGFLSVLPYWAGNSRVLPSSHAWNIHIPLRRLYKMPTSLSVQVKVQIPQRMYQESLGNLYAQKR